MDGFLYTDSEIRMHADWLLFGPTLDAIEALDVEEPRVADIGCGTGAFGMMLAVRGVTARYVGVDLSEVNLRTGRNGYGLKTLLLGDAGRLPFADDAFDAVVSCGLVQSLPNPWAAIGEMLRVGGGRVAMEIAEGPMGVNTFFEAGLSGMDELVALYNQNQLLDAFVKRELPAPDRILSRTAHTDHGLGKPFYRNVPHRVRSVYFWGL